MSTQQTIRLGLDAGMGALKCAWQAGTLEYVSQVATNGADRAVTTVGLKSSKPPMHVEFGGQSFWTGPRAHDWGRPIESLDYERLNGSPEMRALFYSLMTGVLVQNLQTIDALRKQHKSAARSGKPPAELDALADQAQTLLDGDYQIVVGLPHGSVRGEQGAANIAAVKAWLEGDHRWTANGVDHGITVAKVQVATQATGALFDYLLDDAGKFIPERKGAFTDEVGVISVGFNTVELQVVRNKEELPALTRGETVGVRRLIELADPKRLYSLGEMDTQIRTGHANIKSVLPTWERDVIGFIEKVWETRGKTWQRFAAVIIVGGGAHLLRETLPYRFNGKAVMPDQPVMSVARGLFKLSEMRNHKA